MTAAANAELIRRFYEAFGVRDAETMASCYADDAIFRDPAFGELRGERTRDMWRMLCRAGRDLVVSVRDIATHGDRGTATWQADYTFSATGRPVHNVVQASFQFRDGRIARHTDEFDFGRWAGQAFGPVGAVLGRTPVLPPLFRLLSNRQLDRFVGRQG